MDFTPLEKDMNIISALDDEPNDVGGLTATELKAKFDEGGNAIKDYLNNTVIPEVKVALGDKAGKDELQGLVLGQIPDGTITEDKLSEELKEQIGSMAPASDVFTKEETLRPETAAMYGLSGEDATPENVFHTLPRIGEVVQSMRADFLEQMGDHFLPCKGQIYPSDKYPLYSAAQGPLTGTIWTQKLASEYPDDLVFYLPQFMVQTHTGRVIVCGKRDSSANYGIFISDDNCKTFTLRLDLNTTSASVEKPIPDGGVYSIELNQVLLFGYGTRWISTDNGETWTTAQYSGAPNNYLSDIHELSDGRLIGRARSANFVLYSDDHGLNWTQVGVPYVSNGRLNVTKNGNILVTSANFTATPSTDRRIYMSKDGGQTFSLEASNVYTGASISWVGIVNYSGSTVFAFSQKDVFASYDYGDSWTKILEFADLMSANNVVVSGTSVISYRFRSFDGCLSYLDTGSLGISTPNNVFSLQNGTVVVIDSRASRWIYFEPSTNMCYLPNIPNSYIRIK